MESGFSLGTRTQYLCSVPDGESVGLTVTWPQAGGIVKSTMPPTARASLFHTAYLVAPGIGGRDGIGPV